MILLSVDFEEITGRIKPMHAVGQPPFVGTDFSFIKYLKEANIPFARLHDVGGAYGGNRYVDIPNIFRDFDADENDPASYDFAFTDLLIRQLMENDCIPIYRLGVTIENAAAVHAYRIFPPKDYAKWARICEHIIRHYNEGWADGFHCGIRYWEIWNEPEITPDIKDNTMWKGTPEQYYALYDTAAKHLKGCFGDQIKIGGYASSGFYRVLSDPAKYGLPADAEKKSNFRQAREIHMLSFFYGFMEYIREHRSPLDFFSWHSYATVEETVLFSDFLHRTLTEYGYGHAESLLTEWNNGGGIRNRGTDRACAGAAAMLLAMQNTQTDILNYYDARIGLGDYGLMFSPLDYKPENIYYAFKAFGHLYALGNQTRCALDGARGLYAVAAADGDRKAVMLVNTTETDADISSNLGGDFRAYLVDSDHFLTPTELCADRFTLQTNRVLLLRNDG